MTRLILIRHGETPWTREKRYQGSRDIELSRQGRKSMQALALRLKKMDLKTLYTSALKRARQSGEAISACTGLKAKADARLNELDFGCWEGHTAEELILKKDKAFQSWAKGKWQTPAGGESLESLRKRAHGFLKDCLKENKNKIVAVVSHGGMIRMLILEALGLEDRHLFSFSADPASFSILEFSGARARLLCMNI